MFLSTVLIFFIKSTFSSHPQCKTHFWTEVAQSTVSLMASVHGGGHHSVHHNLANCMSMMRHDQMMMKDFLLTEIKVFPARRLVRRGVRVWGVCVWMGRV